MRLPVLRFGAFLLVLSGIGAAYATEAGVMVGGEAVTLSAVTLDIVQNGRKVGSTQVPAGRRVDVVEVGEGRAKVAAEPFLSGWVPSSALQMVAAAPLPTAQGELPPAAPQPETQAKATRGQTSRIDIKETRTTEAIVAQPPSKCRGLEHFVSFQPTVTRGSDLEGKEAVLRFHLIVMQEDKEEAESTRRRNAMGRKSYEPAVRRLKDLVLLPDRADIPPFRHDYIEGQCSCCRGLRHGELVGWYAELLDGDNVAAKTQSSLDTRASKALQSSLARDVGEQCALPRL